MMGTADDTLTKNFIGATPMLHACFGGHPDVAKKLCEVDAAGDIRTAVASGDTSMMGGGLH